MSIKQRAVASLATLLLAAGGLAFSGVTAGAFSCGGTIVQKDNYYHTSSYYLHHWNGACDNGLNQYYGGSDSRYSWGGSWHPINKIDTHLRGWNCAGSLFYDSDITLPNTAYNQLQTPWACWIYNETDNNNQEYQPGAFNWWDYLNISG